MDPKPEWSLFRTAGGVVVIAMEGPVVDCGRLKVRCRRWRDDGSIGGWHGWLVVSRMEPLSDGARAVVGN